MGKVIADRFSFVLNKLPELGLNLILNLNFR